MTFSLLSSSAEVTDTFRVQYASDWSDNLFSGSRQLGVILVST